MGLNKPGEIENRFGEGKKLPLKEWADEKWHNQEFIRDRPFDNDIIITMYDTDKQKRLIIDGIHRATILRSEYENRHVELLSPMRVWECYGSRLLQFFHAILFNSIN